MTEADDASITDSDVLYRRVHRKQVVSTMSGEPRLSSAVFKPNKQVQGGLSAFLQSALAAIPAMPADCLPEVGEHSIAAIKVGDLRGAGHGVLRDPGTNAPVPNACDQAHALITGFSDARSTAESQARVLAMMALWPVERRDSLQRINSGARVPRLSRGSTIGLSSDQTLAGAAHPPSRAVRCSVTTS